MVYFSRILAIFFACYILANTVYLIDSGSASNLEVKYKHEIVFTTVSLLMLQIKSECKRLQGQSHCSRLPRTFSIFSNAVVTTWGHKCWLTEWDPILQ